MIEVIYLFLLCNLQVVGLLDPAVPLPPDTPEHLSTFLAIHFYLNTQITVEAESQTMQEEEDYLEEFSLLQPFEREAYEREAQRAEIFSKEERIRRRQRIADRQAQESHNIINCK